MVSMETDSNSCEAISENKYGYGLQINLNDEQCEALGITQPLRAGTKVKISALAFVTNATESVEDDGDDAGNEIRLSLQITDMEFAGMMDTKAIAEKLYGKP